jgi:hypothetical protein
MCLSVDDIGKLCHTLQVDPAVLLAPDSTEAETAVPRLTPSQVVALVRDHLAATGLTPEVFAEQVGWEVTQILSDPNELWALNVDGLYDVCTGANVNWLQALPPPP